MLVPFIKPVASIKIPDSQLNQAIRSIITELVDILLLDPFQASFKFQPVLLFHYRYQGKLRELRLELDMNSRSVTVFNTGCCSWYYRYFSGRIVESLLPAVQLALGDYLLDRPWETGRWLIEADFVSRQQPPRAVFHLTPDLAA